MTMLLLGFCFGTVFGLNIAVVFLRVSERRVHQHEANR